MLPCPLQYQIQSPLALDPSLLKVGFKVGSVERAGSLPPVVTIKSFLDSWVDSGVIDHRHITSRAGLKLKFVVGREVSEVLDLEALPVAHLWCSSSLLVPAVTGSGSTENSRVGVGSCGNSRSASLLLGSRNI